MFQIYSFYNNVIFIHVSSVIGWTVVLLRKHLCVVPDRKNHMNVEDMFDENILLSSMFTWLGHYLTKDMFLCICADVCEHTRKNWSEAYSGYNSIHLETGDCYICVCMYMCVCMYVCVYVCICVCVFGTCLTIGRKINIQVMCVHIRSNDKTWVRWI